jgi:hypothetical protein
MLKIDKVQQIETAAGNIQCYGDDLRDQVFYILPNGPRFRVGEDGKPVFRFIKYREIREDNSKFFGGLVAFDTCLAVSKATVEEVKAKLQPQVNAIFQGRGQESKPVEIAPLTYTGGTVNLTIEGAGNQLVQKVNSAGVPSLYGDNVATFWVELSKEGSTIFEAAMKGEGGFVGVFYKTKVWAQLPPIKGHAFWNASKFYDFAQTIDTEDNFWSEDSYEENIRETMISNDVQDVKLDMIAIPGMPADQQKALEDELRANLNRDLEKAVERNMLKEIQAVDPDTKSLREDQDIEDIKRTVSKTHIANVTIDLSETHTIEWTLNPQGTLPNITTMVGPDGQKIKWEHYYMEVDLNDPFFQTIEISVMVNANFEDLPLFSVEAKLTYPLGDQKTQEFVFKGPDDIGKFSSFIVDKNKKYKYSYAVNYKNESQPFRSEEIETDDTQLTINVDDLGIWVVDIAPGDINFTQVKQAQIAVRNEEVDPPVELQFTMTEAAGHFKVREVTMQKMRGSYKYRVKYFMADGKEFERDWTDHDAPQLFIDDPFAASQTVSLRAVGDLANKIASIMVDLTYTDETNDYVQKKTMNLSAETAFFDWTFPVISETGGKVKYAGTIQYKDGTSAEIVETEATRATIQLGDVVTDRLNISVVPDLLDFATVKLVSVSLHYDDPGNGVSKNQDFMFKAGEAAKSWTVDLKDKQKKAYQWNAKFFLTDGSNRTIPPPSDPQHRITSEESTIILELPAA